MALCLLGGQATAITVVEYDFTQGDEGWQVAANGSIANLAFSDDGVAFDVVAGDPYVWSPVADYPADKPVRLMFRMRSTGEAAGEIFWGADFAPERQLAFSVINDGAWHTYQVDLPALGTGASVRIDPSQTSGHIELRWVRTIVNDVGEELAYWDFRSGFQGWFGNAYVDQEQITSLGYEFDSLGNDPWIEGGYLTVDSEYPILCTIRLSSDAPGAGRLFWTQTVFNETQAISFSFTNDGTIQETTALLEPMTGTYYLRFDPGGGEGHIVMESIRFETIVPPDDPPFNPPTRPDVTQPTALNIVSGPLTLKHGGEHWGQFVLECNGIEMASGQQEEFIGFLGSDFTDYLFFEQGTTNVEIDGTDLVESWSMMDAGGAQWSMVRRFSPGAIEGAFDIELALDCTQAREIVHVPWLTIFPGLDNYSTSKTQALLAGIEYLADEPSSSEADLTGVDHVRLVPSPHKFTFPLAALVHEGCYIGLSWQWSDHLAMVHDTPDRVFDSNAHLMALWGPGVGNGRDENQLVASEPVAFSPGETWTVRGRIYGGEGTSIVPAVQDFVAWEGLPPLPQPEGGLDGAVELLAEGWTLSAAYDGNGKWAHAYWPGFGFGVAADALYAIKWLSLQTNSTETKDLLDAAFAAGYAQTVTADPNFNTGVSHVRWPTAQMLWGNLTNFFSYHYSIGVSWQVFFDGDGIAHYEPASGGTDYSTTHFADHANGYASARLVTILDAALYTMNPTLISQAIALLDKQTTLYRDTVPRGAQTWEVPLHTPDILASANLVKAYTIGYELTGREDLLDEARYWAWTGVPFVYLQRSFGGETGDYATIAVLGATGWVAPVWIGQPVQWCGLVYRTQLLRLAVYDPDGPWEQIAHGITRSGLQQTWDSSDAERRGLLPDFFHLLTQVSDGPAINSGTVQANVAEAFGQPGMYEMRKVNTLGWYVHAPGGLMNFVEHAEAIVFRLTGWGDVPYKLFINNVVSEPTLILNGTPGDNFDDFTTPDYLWDATNKRLTLYNLVGPKVFYLGEQRETAVKHGAFVLYD